MKKIAVSVSSSKGTNKHGVWAYVVPLRYVGGAKERRGQRYGIPGFFRYESPDVEKRQPEALYIMTFLVPKFFRLTPEERLETIVHEIYHLHPTLRGDLRLFDPPHRHHGPTPAQYKARVRELMKEALATSPWLAEHPLLKGDGSEYEERSQRRFRIPRHVFRPGLWLWLVALSAMPVASARQIVLKSTQALRSIPKEDGAAQLEIAAGRKLRALKLSKDRNWVFVSDGASSGWVPRAAVNTVPTAKSSGAPKSAEKVIDPFADGSNAPTGGGEAPGEFDPFGGGDAPPDDSLEDAKAPPAKDEMADAPESEEGFSQDFAAEAPKTARTQGPRGPLPDVPQDSKQDPYIATKAGKLFEEASALAVRYGIVEVNDTLKIRGRSKDRKWVQVRIDLTGEEGWYPAAWVRRKRIERLAKTPQGLLHVHGGYGTGGYGLAFFGGYSQNIWENGRENRPFDRLEIGGEVGYTTGFSVTSGDVTASASFFEFQVLARYLAATGTGHLRGGPEIGAAVGLPILSADGLTEEVKSQVGLSSSPTFAGILGATVGYGLSGTTQLRGSLRLRIGSGRAFMMLFGAAFAFE